MKSTFSDFCRIIWNEGYAVDAYTFPMFLYNMEKLEF